MHVLARVTAVHWCVHVVDSIQVKRGGLITFHGPGQLVCYPVLNLRHMKVSITWRCKDANMYSIEDRLSACVPLYMRIATCTPYISLCMTVFVCMQVGVRKYVCALEKAVIAVCKSFGVNPTTAEETGVWVNDCKICSVGR